MDKLEQIITIASACLGFVVTFTSFLIPLVKNVKAKNKLIALNKMTATLHALITEAETFTHFSGAEKKEYVMTKANRYALENNITYDEQAISEKIEDMIALSKEVNKRGTESTTNKEAVTTSIRI